MIKVVAPFLILVTSAVYGEKPPPPPAYFGKLIGACFRAKEARTSDELSQILASVKSTLTEVPEEARARTLRFFEDLASPKISQIPTTDPIAPRRRKCQSSSPVPQPRLSTESGCEANYHFSIDARDEREKEGSTLGSVARYPKKNPVFHFVPAIDHIGHHPDKILQKSEKEFIDKFAGTIETEIKNLPPNSRVVLEAFPAKLGENYCVTAIDALLLDRATLLTRGEMFFAARIALENGHSFVGAEPTPEEVRTFFKDPATLGLRRITIGGKTRVLTELDYVYQSLFMCLVDQLSRASDRIIGGGKEAATREAERRKKLRLNLPKDQKQKQMLEQLQFCAAGDDIFYRQTPGYSIFARNFTEVGGGPNTAPLPERPPRDFRKFEQEQIRKIRENTLPPERLLSELETWYQGMNQRDLIDQYPDIYNDSAPEPINSSYRGTQKLMAAIGIVRNRTIRRQVYTGVNEGKQVLALYGEGHVRQNQEVFACEFEKLTPTIGTSCESGRGTKPSKSQPREDEETGHSKKAD